jgi:beta-mannosidase
LERARTRWPDCTGSLYYKMNDNYPAASWSCVDWYGAPKIGHYVFQDAFAPLHACVLFEGLNTAGRELALPVCLIDDADALRAGDWTVVVRAYASDLREIKRESFEGAGSVDRVAHLGEFSLDADQNSAAPLLTVAEVLREGRVDDRTFYWTNYEAVPGCLRSLPRTTLSLDAGEGTVTVKNTGRLPAVGVHLVCPGAAHEFRADDGFFWLDPGESRIVAVNRAEGVEVQAWNAWDCSGGTMNHEC